MTTRPTLAYGSYIRTDLLGLGADDAKLQLADQVMLQILAQAGVAPQTVTEWAQQSGDVSWQQTTALNNYQLFALSDAQIVACATAATAVPTTLAVVAPFLSFASQLTEIFKQTPYAYSRTEAVYFQQDLANPPHAYFLYWLTLRPQADKDRGNLSLNLTAAKTGGLLAYVQETPFTGQERPAPTTPFQTALAQQSGQVTATPSAPSAPTISATLPPLQPGQSTAPPRAPAATGSDTTKALLVGGAIAGVLYLAYSMRSGSR